MTFLKKCGFQPGEGPSRGLLRDYKPSDGPSFQALSKAGEDSADCKALVGKSDNVINFLSGLNTEAETEAAKFGEDVKHLADVTNSCKKFDPWVKKSEEKVRAGMKKAGSLPEANTLMDEVKAWQAESVKMKQVLDNGNAAAQKMSMHEDADRQTCKRCLMMFELWPLVRQSVVRVVLYLGTNLIAGQPNI